MGDQVQRTLERMVPELEDFQRKKIFTAIEVKSIVRKRTAFEYMFRRREPKLLDFLRYIEYEINLGLLRRKRKNKIGLTKQSICDFAAPRNIQFIYERALRRFSDDIGLWLQYINFCRKAGSSRVLAKIFPKVLQLHPLVSELWIRAASYEANDNNNIASARVLLQRGLRLNPESEELWHFFFQMELQYIRKLRERKQALGLLKSDHLLEGPAAEETLESDTLSLARATDSIDEKDRAFLTGAVPKAIFENAIKSKSLAANWLFRLRFLALIPAGKSSFHTDFIPLAQQIYDSLGHDFPVVEECWDVRARWALSLAVADGERGREAEEEEQAAKRTKTTEGSGSASRPMPENAALLVWEEALERVDTGKMWTLYGTFLAARMAKYSEVGNAGAVKDLLTRLLHLMRRAKAGQRMSPELYSLWVSSLLAVPNVEAASKVLDEALAADRFPQSLELWKVRLQIDTHGFSFNSDLDKHQFTVLHQTHDRALKALSPAHHAPVLTSLLRACMAHYQAICSTYKPTSKAVRRAHTSCRKCFQQALKSQAPAEVLSQWMAWYLDWTVLSITDEEEEEGEHIAAIRLCYQKMLRRPPVSLEVYLKCVEVEHSMAPTRGGHLRQAREVYEKASVEHSHNPDFWLAWARTECALGEVAASGRLHRRALKALEGSAQEEFILQFQKINR